MASSRRQPRRQPVRSPQGGSTFKVARPSIGTTRVLERPDYAREYAYVRKDLILIAIIGGLLFVGMIAASFVL